jgi:hypothetical protein
MLDLWPMLLCKVARSRRRTMPGLVPTISWFKCQIAIDGTRMSNIPSDIGLDSRCSCFHSISPTDLCL